MPKPPTEAFNWRIWVNHDTMYFNFANNTQCNQISTATHTGNPRHGNGAEASSGHKYNVSTGNIVKKVELNPNLEQSYYLTFSDGKKDIKCMIRLGRHFSNPNWPHHSSFENVQQLISNGQKKGIIS